MSFSAKFRLTLSWSDQRLSFNNLNRDMFLNLPNSWEKHKIWIPVLIFHNTKTNYETLLDPQARIYVNRSGNYSISSEFAGADSLVDVFLKLAETASSNFMGH